MKKIPMLERFAAQSLVESDGELIFSKEKFAQLIVAECGVALSPMLRDMVSRGQAHDLIKKHFGVEE
jgi:hypothetical protein